MDHSPASWHMRASKMFYSPFGESHELSFYEIEKRGGWDGFPILNPTSGFPHQSESKASKERIACPTGSIILNSELNQATVRCMGKSAETKAATL